MICCFLFFFCCLHSLNVARVYSFWISNIQILHFISSRENTITQSKRIERQQELKNQKPIKNFVYFCLGWFNSNKMIKSGWLLNTFFVVCIFSLLHSINVETEQSQEHLRSHYTLSHPKIGLGNVVRIYCDGAVIALFTLLTYTLLVIQVMYGISILIDWLWKVIKGIFFSFFLHVYVCEECQ